MAADPVEGFLAYSTVSRVTLGVHPEWRDWLEAAVRDGTPRLAGRMRADLDDWLRDAAGFDAALDRLRAFKRREMLRIGARDWADIATVEETVMALSALADECIGRVAHLCWARVAERRGGPECDWIVLGLGKLGGRELNYSSDVDLMLVYGEEGETEGGLTRHEWYNQWGKLFVAKFAERTASGGLFRIDMRLRPDGDSGPLARSLEGCENYYSEFGETWERLALMKARACAGDQELGYEFGVMIQPFCYPRLLSEQVLDEVSHIKDRIENELLDEVTRYSDVKRGVGGIREIEFLVQVFQMLHGGRQAYLQTQGTLSALAAIDRLELMPPEAVRDLRDAYLFWRRLEHRIQMAEERQTHVIPTGAEARCRIARSLGHTSPEAFDAACDRHRQIVRRLFDQLVRTRQGAGSSAPSWDWLGESGRRILEGMRQGPTFSNISPRTRQLFETLEPILESHLRRLVDPERVLAGLENFVERYGARGQLYETWASNPRVLELLVKLFDASQRFRELLVTHPDWLESICRGGRIDDVLGPEDYEAEAAMQEDVEALRSWRWEQGLRIAIQDALGLVDGAQREYEHSGIAQACVRWLCGRLGCPEMAIVAAGKFGGWELCYGSDLDLVFVGGIPDAARSLLRTLSESSSNGILYKADARLRPEGESGILTPDMGQIGAYYRDRAATWEFVALVKFRHAAGDPALAGRFFDVVMPLWLEHGRDPALVDRMLEMKGRIEAERDRASAPETRIKTGPGGVMDIEMAVQCWQLRRGRPEPRLRVALGMMAEEFPGEAATMGEAYGVLRHLESVHRRFEFQSASCLPASPEAREGLARRAGYDSADAMMAEVGRLRGRARASFEGLMRSLRR
ncbi:MAG TPA: hypothetical protein PLU30_20950 [Verrucomicrobiae bacterium]|nr:hypothetical protein [Verrucomicrobiae bacterium]